jgi:transposase
MSDLPVLPSARSRRRRTIAEKLQIVQESLAPGVSIASVALAHRINANQLHKWRWQYRNGELGASDTSAVLLPVRISKALPHEQQATFQKHSSTVSDNCAPLSAPSYSSFFRI